MRRNRRRENGRRIAYSLQSSLRAQIVADVKSEDPLTLDPAYLPQGDVSALKGASAAEVAAGLRVQKLALTVEAQRLGRTCDALAPVPAASAEP
jgi:hypothetical protein